MEIHGEVTSLIYEVSAGQSAIILPQFWQAYTSDSQILLYSVIIQS